MTTTLRVTHEEFVQGLIAKGLPEVYALMVPEKVVYHFYADEVLGRTALKNLLRLTFDWSETPQGHDFWSGLAEEAELLSVPLTTHQRKALVTSVVKDASDEVMDRAIIAFCGATGMLPPGMTKPSLVKRLKAAFKVMEQR